MKALIVEDEFTSRLILQKFLSPHCEVHACANGREGLDAFKAAAEQGTPFDLVCLDVMMPEVDGPTALAGIRSYEEGNGLHGKSRAKILMTTGLGETDSLLDPVRSLYDAILTKPVRLNSLMDTLASLGLT